MRTTIICYYLKHNSTTEPSGLISHQWLCWGSTDPEPRRSARWGESTGLTVKFSAHPQARRYLSCLSLKKTKHEKTISFIWSTFINVLYIKMQARNRKIPEIKYNSLFCTFIHALYQHLFCNTWLIHPPTLAYCRYTGIHVQFMLDDD